MDKDLDVHGLSCIRMAYLHVFLITTLEIDTDADVYQTFTLEHFCENS